jgi:hypothetical protein
VIETRISGLGRLVKWVDLFGTVVENLVSACGRSDGANPEENRVHVHRDRCH